MDLIERVRFQTIDDGSLLREDADDRLARFLSYWRTKRRGGVLPQRRDIDPLEIVKLLPSVFLIDVEEDDFRFSLVGQEILDRYGPLKGQSLRELMSGRELARTLEEHRLCVTARLPVYVENTEHSAAEGDGLLYQRLLLPLAGEGDSITTLAGSMAFRSYRDLRRH
jgi:hypothetical protein